MPLNAINILKFLEKKEGRPIPLRVKLTNNLPLTPEDLNVTGNLGLSRTPINSLPDNLNVVGNLNLSVTPITSLPDNLQVGGHLDLSYTSITSLPDNLNVGSRLFLVNTPLSKQYTKEQIRQMIEDKGGFVKGIYFEYIK